MAMYRKYRDGDFQIIDTKGDLLKLACCDCGLVHYIGITIVDDSLVKLQFAQDKQATAQLRRHKYGFLQQGGVGKYRVVGVGTDNRTD